MTGTQPDASKAPAAERVLTKALLRAASALELRQEHLADVLGVSGASASRLFAGARHVAPDTKEGELALLFLRTFRSLDALVGGREDKARLWFHAPNAHLNGTPDELVRSVQGLVHVAEYLDGLRGTL